MAVDTKVKATIYGHGRGWVFTPRDLAGLGNSHSIGMALTRLAREGMIRRIARGMYEYPRWDPDLGTISPSTSAVIRALADRDAVLIEPTGAHSANLLGLSEQVPMRLVYLTSGRSRSVKIGNSEILLQHTGPRNLATAGRMSFHVINALRWLGQDHIAHARDSIISILSRKLREDDRKQLLKDQCYAPAWARGIMTEVAGK